jgi:hypothetical protein
LRSRIIKTITFAAGAAIGYVLGTKAGREKYQQIVDSVRIIIQKPAVQQVQSKLRDLVDQGTTAVSNKLGVGSDDTDYTMTSFDNGPAATTTRTTSKKAAATTVPLTDAAF